jgi:acetylglutamate kinase
MKKNIEQVQTLLEALPYIKNYAGKTFVIKYGGSAQINPQLKDKFAQDILLMYLTGIKIVIVHGGGKKINSTLERMQIESEFIDGLRVTCDKTMEVVEMVLAGNINKEITTLLNEHGAKALGITGKDASLLKAKAKDDGKYGFVGEITNIENGVIHKLLDEKFIPVIAPIASGEDIGHIGYNINADLAASKIASSLNAEKIIFMTDIPGVLDKDKNLFDTLSSKQIKKLKKDGTISGGMIPKVDACTESINGGVKKAHIIDGRVEHALLLEVFTSNGVGTVIKKKTK